MFFLDTSNIKIFESIAASIGGTIKILMFVCHAIYKFISSQMLDVYLSKYFSIETPEKLINKNNISNINNGKLLSNKINEYFFIN